jgi:hypothetical protein
MIHQEETCSYLLLQLAKAELAPVCAMKGAPAIFNTHQGLIAKMKEVNK